MGNILNQDIIDFLKALNESRVEYILVGGYAVVYHGYTRTTGDLDIWVNPSEDNYNKLLIAFEKFGMSVFNLTKERFLDTTKDDVFTFGRSPVSINILSKATGLIFAEAFSNAKMVDFDGVPVNMIDIRDLLTAKKAVNRPKDQDDLEHLK
jgi:predicted nucleotidyltransferase